MSLLYDKQKKIEKCIEQKLGQGIVRWWRRGEIMRKDRKRKHKMIGRQAKQREVLKDYLNKEITITGTFDRIKDVVSLNYVGKSILLTDIKFKDKEIQHMWIHQKAINNWHKLKKGDTVVLKGTVYGYSHSYCNKVLAVKYSLENITLIHD